MMKKGICFCALILLVSFGKANDVSSPEALDISSTNIAAGEPVAVRIVRDSTQIPFSPLLINGISDPRINYLLSLHEEEKQEEVILPLLIGDGGIIFKEPGKYVVQCGQRIAEVTVSAGPASTLDDYMALQRYFPDWLSGTWNQEAYEAILAFCRKHPNSRYAHRLSLYLMSQFSNGLESKLAEMAAKYPGEDVQNRVDALILSQACEIWRLCIKTNCVDDWFFSSQWDRSAPVLARLLCGAANDDTSKNRPEFLAAKELLRATDLGRTEASPRDR